MNGIQESAVIKQLEMFEEPKEPEAPLPEEVTFTRELSDSVMVKTVFEYVIRGMPHYNFYGEVSETGYRSYFPYHYATIHEEQIKPLAEEAAEMLHANYLAELKTSARRTRKKIAL
jgi:hypothetical protein